ncbi:hypothetical protein [Bradyrhizobium sp. 33ap4]|uniref:hypothetical protein n=1 Tax=Bradyrhizobium sp. 33ap4 TaxID=3061630 RepID=UPI00292E65B1|nr:hypothetical protein [Bradyrhizobium sp. 33ap4]
MPKKPKNQRSKRTSIWLDNALRAKLDERAEREGRSLAGSIDFYLRKGLGLKTGGNASTNEEKPDAAAAPIFG